MRDVATVHVLGQLPKCQLARMVLNHSDVSVRCSDLAGDENRNWCKYTCHLYSHAPHHQVPLEIVVQSQLALPRGSSMQIHHPGSSSPMSDEVVLSKGHLDVNCFLQEDLFGVPGLVNR